MDLFMNMPPVGMEDRVLLDRWMTTERLDMTGVYVECDLVVCCTDMVAF